MYNFLRQFPLPLLETVAFSAFILMLNAAG